MSCPHLFEAILATRFKDRRFLGKRPLLQDAAAMRGLARRHSLMRTCSIRETLRQPLSSPWSSARHKVYDLNHGPRPPLRPVQYTLLLTSPSR